MLPEPAVETKKVQSEPNQVTTKVLYEPEEKSQKDQVVTASKPSKPLLT